MSLACRGCSGEGNFPLLGLKSWKGTCERVVTQCDTHNVPQLYILHGFQAEPAPGHLHQGGILISRGGTNHVCVCVWGGWVGQVGSVPSVIACSWWRSRKRAIAFMCAVLSVFSSTFEIDHVQQGGERMKSGGHSNSFGGARPTNAPPWRRPWFQVLVEH